LQSAALHAKLAPSRLLEARLSDCDPIAFRPRAQADASGRGAATTSAASPQSGSTAAAGLPQTRFSRIELNEILALYGRKVAAGEWRDYAIDLDADKAVFAVYRRTSEFPLYRIEKNPKLARKQGAYSVIAPNGLILKRGPDLKRVLGVLEKTVKVVG
jgi:hypothetical protein